MVWTKNSPGIDAARSGLLRVYGGEVLAAYNDATKIKDKIRTRNISNGKSAQFPIISSASAKLHTPGDDLFADAYKSGITNTQTEIHVNKMLIDTAFVDNAEDMMSHYDSRSEYAAQMGAALGVACDKWALGALSVGASATQVGLGEYTAVIANGDTMRTELEVAAATLDNAGVPAEGRYVVVSPTQYYTLVATDGMVSKDFGSGTDRNKPGTLHYMGIEVISSAVWNDFANSAGTEASGGPLEDIPGAHTSTTGSYAKVLTKVWGMVFHKDAAGFVSLKGLTTSSDWVPERQGNLLVAKQLVGCGILRPTSAILLSSTT